MSIENSLSQLKNNFAAATGNGAKSVTGSIIGTTPLMSTAAAASPAATDSTASSAHASCSTLSTSNGNTSNINTGGSSSNNAQFPNVKYAPSALTERVSSMTFLGGMLSRDDSLINLAMLPTLDNVRTNYNGNGGSVGVSRQASNSSNTSQDYMRGILSRDDSLMNLAKIVDAATGSTDSPTILDNASSSLSTVAAAAAAAGTETATVQLQDGGPGGDGSGDTFDFIDFQS